MTVSTLRPTGTTSNTGALTGGATAHAVLSDDSDATYVTFDTVGEAFRVTLGDLTLPSGAVIKGVAARIRSGLSSAGASDTAITVSYAHPVDPPTGIAPSSSYAITWASIQTITGPSFSASGITDSNVDGEYINVVLATLTVGRNARIYEAYFDATYVEVPEVSADAPTGTVSDTNLPDVEWSNTLDSDGGAQTTFEVKVYTDAEYGAGGFDPDTSTPTATSGITTSSSTTWQVDETLPDDTYRAYVRVAQTVNGVLHWSDWDFTEFTISVALPAAPTFTATADNANGRITLAFDDNAGSATTDVFELQRSLDGGTTWETVRQLDAGYLTPSGGTASVYDYEAPNGTTRNYRGRALHNYSGVYAASAWVTDSEAWSSATWWLKHPHQPTLNASVTVREFPAVARAGRQGVFQPLGASYPVVVTDTRQSREGSVILRSDSFDDQDELDDLIDTGDTLLLQGPATAGWHAYIKVTNHERARTFNGQGASMVFEALSFVEVDSPTGDVVAWP